MAKALKVNFRALYDPTLYSFEDVIYTMFELDEHYTVRLMETQNEYEETEYGIVFDSEYMVNRMLKDWFDKKHALEKGEITKDQYYEWKMNWPESTDEDWNPDG